MTLIIFYNYNNTLNTIQFVQSTVKFLSKTQAIYLNKVNKSLRLHTATQQLFICIVVFTTNVKY